MARPEDVAHEALVSFRVQWIDLHPLGEDNPSDHVVLGISPVGQPAAACILSQARYEPYHDAVTDAIASQAVYWVQLDRSEISTLPPRLDDPTFDRLLEAIQNRQVVPSRDPE